MLSTTRSTPGFRPVMSEEDWHDVLLTARRQTRCIAPWLSETDIEDIAQETAIRMMRALPANPELARDWRGLVQNIARARLFSLLRSRRLRTEADLGDLSMNDLGCESRRSPYRITETARRRWEAVKSTLTLGRTQRRILDALSESVSISQISRDLGIPRVDVRDALRGVAKQARKRIFSESF